MLKLVEKFTNQIKEKLPKVEKEGFASIENIEDVELKTELTNLINEAKSGKITPEEAICRVKKWM